jgi:hypothetical protein
LFWGVVILPLFAFVWENTTKLGKCFLVILLCWQLSVVGRTLPADYFHRSVQDYNFFGQSTSTLNENRSRTFTLIELGNWQPTPQIISGDAAAVIQYWRGSRREYDLTVKTDTTVVEPTMNFLGWQTHANGNLVSYVDSDVIGGRVAYTLAPGQYHLKSEFTQWTPARVIGNSVSLLTSIGCSIWLVWQLYQLYQHYHLKLKTL